MVCVCGECVEHGVGVVVVGVWTGQCEESGEERL